MKVLVTGASGFIGSTLIGQLNRLGIEPFALLRKTSDTSNLQGLKYHRREGDLSHLDSLKEAVQDVDVIYHLAGATMAPDREAFFRHNAQGTALLARAAAEARPGLKRFVFVSSMAAGGPSTSPSPKLESDPDQPVSLYGESKLQGEKDLLRHKDIFPISIIRPPMVYGPRDKGVFIAIQTVSRGVMPILQGATPDRNKHYSAIHSDDLCQAILQAGAVTPDQVASGEIFYIAADGVFTYREMLKTIARHLDRKAVAFPVPRFAITAGAMFTTVASKVTGKTYALNLDKLGEIHADFWVCSNEKAKTKLGFKPKYDFDTGMSDAIEWYKKEKWI